MADTAVMPRDSATELRNLAGKFKFQDFRNNGGGVTLHHQFERLSCLVFLITEQIGHYLHVSVTGMVQTGQPQPGLNRLKQ